MTIAFLGKHPKVKMSEEIKETLRMFSISCEDTSTLFLETSRKGNVYTIVDVYVPKQHVNGYHDIIEQQEVALVGEKYMGVCLCGKPITNKFTKNNLKFVRNTCYGVNNYVAMQVTRTGEFCIVVFDGNYVFYDVEIEIPYEFSKELKTKVESAIAKNIVAWEFKAGYDDTVRNDYILPEIISKKLGWRDVV